MLSMVNQTLVGAALIVLIVALVSVVYESIRYALPTARDNRKAARLRLREYKLRYNLYETIKAYQKEMKGSGARQENFRANS